MNTLSVRKILQILYYIQNSPFAVSVAKNSIMYFLKIIFFADRFHLRNYGITVTYDSYYAMERGPVASSVYDILQKKLPINCNGVDARFLDDIIITSEYTINIQHQRDDEMSQSDKEALDFSLKEFGKYDQFQLSEMTHDYPEWKKYEKQLLNSDLKIKRFDMDFKDFFDNPKELVYLQQYGKEKDPFCEKKEFLEDMKEYFVNDTSAN